MWNSSRTQNRIRFEEDAVVGSVIKSGPITAVLTSRGASGTVSNVTVTFSTGVVYGDTRVYCRDPSDGGGSDTACQPIRLMPSESIISVLVTMAHCT